jgi:hypothetical protein
LFCQNPSVNPIYQVVGSTTGNQNQLNDPFYGIYQATADWYVEADLGYSCLAQKVAAGKSANVSRSNISNNRIVPIGIKSNTLRSGITVFPNPAQKFLKVNFESLTDEAELKMTNLLGQTVYSEKVTTNKTIDVSAFAKGIYTLSINVNGGKTVYKIIVD